MRLKTFLTCLLFLSVNFAIAQEITVVGRGQSVQSHNALFKPFTSLSFIYDGSKDVMSYAESEMKSEGFKLRQWSSEDRGNGIQVTKTYEGLVTEFPFPAEEEDSDAKKRTIVEGVINGTILMTIVAASYATGGSLGVARDTGNVGSGVYLNDPSAPQILKSEIKGNNCQEMRMVKLRAQHVNENCGVAIAIAATCDPNAQYIDMERVAMKEVLKRMSIY